MVKASTSPAETELACAGLVWGDNLARVLSTFKPIPRTPRAAKSHPGFAGRSIHWARVDGGAARDCSQLGVVLGEPSVLALELPDSLLPLCRSDLEIDNGTLVERRQPAPEPRQRGVVGRFIETALADPGRRCRGRGCGHGCTT
jgi:hypothetical protein